MTGPNLALIAWRNLWRQKRRTLLTLASIAFGGMMAFLMTAMQDRSFADFIDTAARLGGGHVTLQHPEYQETPSLTRTVSGTAELRALASQDPRVRASVERIVGQAMVSTANDSYGVGFIAFDPGVETSETFRFLGGLVKGKMFESTRDKGIILGKKLASNLGAELGDKIVWTMMDRSGEVVAGMGRLSGVIGTGAPSMDASLCLLPIDVVRDALSYAPDEATQVGLFLGDSRRSPQVASRLNTAMSGLQKPAKDRPLALTWDEISPDLRSFIAMKVGGGRVMEIIIGLLVVAGIFNTLFVSVMERVREFGIQLAIGWTPGQLFRMIMWESLFLGVMGLVCAVLLTAGPYLHLSRAGIDMSKSFGDGTEISGVGFDMIMRIGIFPENAVIISLAILLATLTAGLYPAWKACRTEPVETIKLV